MFYKMAQKILNDLLNLKVTPDKIIDWLTIDNFNDVQWIDFNKNCTREEFVTFFLNYLQDQFIRILQSNNIFNQTAVNKILPQPQIINTRKLLKTDVELKHNDNEHFNEGIFNDNESQNPIECQISLSEQNITSSVCESVRSEKKNLNSKFLKSTPVKHSVAIEIENTFVNVNSVSSTMALQTSTPITKYENSPYTKRVELINCNLAESNHINPVFKENFEYERVNNITDSRSISFDDNSFPSLGENISNSLNNNISANIQKKSEHPHLFNSNVSQKSNFSLSNSVLQSPVSSQESRSLSMLSPVNIKVSKNRYNSQSNNSYFRLNSSSSPEKSVNNVPKNSKTNPRQNICLGDFIGTEIRSIKKNSGKKYSAKILSKNGEQKDSDKNSIVSDSSFKHLEHNRRRRKVNPTRLNDTDEKGNKENTIFGVVTRPFTQNPQFVNVSPIDKSIDNASFQLERGLVKKEREKKPEVIVNKSTEMNINVNDEQNLLCTLPKISCKIKKLHSIIIPNKTLVENTEVLNVLSILYSRLLDYNLVVNPMTELYFIILLITIQYKNDTKLSSISSKINKKIQNVYDNNSSNDLNDVQSNLLLLRKSLNFDDLKENNYNNDEYNKNNRQNDSDKLENYNLTDDTKENLNQINKKLKQTSVNIIGNEKVMGIIEENNIEKLDATNECVKKYLDTPHNCVYFSTQVLYHQKAFLKYLDRVTLKLLCENSHIANFQPELYKYLDKIYGIKVAESNKTKCFLNIGNVDLNVSFQIDTDNREKFPSTIAFQCFRKQRDMFYEILKIWEDNHLFPGWKFKIALGGKIKTLLRMHADITNYTHFTRLFKSQMLISCIHSEQQDDLLDNETLSLLKNLKDNNLEKLTKLQKKLVTPLFQNGPVPLPSFPGIQEFYKDFIFYSFHPVFYAYLENTFIHEIMELNDSQFSGSDIEEIENEVDERTKQNFFVCLSSLRLLSKFLGFVTSLPYRSETSMLEDVITSQIILRSKCLPHIDLQYYLQIAAIEGKLSLTVPWVVEYLGMMDHATLRLPYYKRVLEILYCIYRSFNFYAAMNLDLMSQRTSVLIKFIIGWLFELPIFPKELYYSWQSKYSNKALKLICDMLQPVNKFEYSLNDIETSVVSVKHCSFLDKLEIIDERILYNCCPFLKELNILLTPGNSTINSSTSCRHITPVTSQLQKSVKKINMEHLEIQLEEAFFHGQPMSTRKTVEYISERVASSCIKYVYNNLLPAEKRISFEALKSLYEENYSKTYELNPKLVQSSLRNDMNLLSAEASKNIKEKCEQVIPKICQFRITQSIESLLSEDCLQPVKNMCVKIAMRTAMERIDQWIQSHIIGDTIFFKDMDSELNRFLKPYDEIIIDKNLHNPDAASPANILDDMRNFICDLIETKGSTITLDSLFKFCNRLYESLTQRSDLKCISESTISSLSVDLCLFLITYKYDLFTAEIQEQVFKVWKIDRLKFSAPDSPLSRILSPRNIMLMAQSDNNNVWKNCGKFLNRLLKRNILSIDSLSDQAVALFRNEWAATLTKKLSMCLNEAIESLKSLDEETERIRYLLEWIAGTYNDMDHESFRFY